MSGSALKTILISLKLLVIAALLIKGLLLHCRMENRNCKVIAILISYLGMLVLITVAELFYEFIPLIFVILIIASALQVY